MFSGSGSGAHGGTGGGSSQDNIVAGSQGSAVLCDAGNLVRGATSVTILPSKAARTTGATMHIAAFVHGLAFGAFATLEPWHTKSSALQPVGSCDQITSCSCMSMLPWTMSPYEVRNVPAGTTSPSQALRGTGPRVSCVSAPSKASDVQDARKQSFAKTSSRPTLGTHSKLLRALSGAASGQVPWASLVAFHDSRVFEHD